MQNSQRRVVGHQTSPQVSGFPGTCERDNFDVDGVIEKSIGWDDQEFRLREA